MEKPTTLLARLLLPVMFSVSTQLAANHSVDIIRNYIDVTYGRELNISQSQIQQLSWVMGNPVFTPERSAVLQSETIHREVPRALARLYCLQLLRSGTEKDYEAFIAPQKELTQSPLSLSEFKQLSDIFKKLDEESYETIAAAALISAVSLSPTARERASHILKTRLPEDSVAFLALTATHATAIYPLAKAIAKKYHSDGHQFEVIFLPDSHLRHMMYNEGSLSMYDRLRKGFKDQTLSQQDLNLWYAYWVNNIAGFRGHLSPKGSIYLTADTYRAMSQLKVDLDNLLQNPDSNPMESYLQKRAQWLELNQRLSRDERLALASLAANIRLFTPDQGKQLTDIFNQLSATEQLRWLKFTRRQRSETNYPAPTYVPALFDNALTLSSMAEALPGILSFYLNVMDREAELRQQNRIDRDTPVSFRDLNNDRSLRQIIKNPSVPFNINTSTGLVKLL